MLKFLRPRSLQFRLFLLLGAFGLAAVLAVGGIAFYFSLKALEQTATADTEREAEILAQFSEVVLVFAELGSPKDLDPGFQALMRDPHVMAMAVYSKDGSLFALHRRPNLPEPFNAPPYAVSGTENTSKWMAVFKPVLSDGQTVGSVYLRRDKEEIHDRFNKFLSGGLAIAAGLSAVALLLASLIGRFIAHPVEALAKLATQVGTDKDYSLRGTRVTNDEIGDLADRFNEMLSQIEAQDKALRRSQDKLEERVEQRTHQLAQSERKLRAILDEIPIPVAIYDVEGELEYLNSEFSRVFGYTIDDLPNLDAWWPRAYPNPDDLAKARAEWTERVLDAMRSDQNIRSYNMRVTTKSDSEIEILAWGRVMDDRIVVLLDDVTEKRKREETLARAKNEAEAANRAKSEFLSRMSHELRTPLNGILGFSKLLEMAKLPERQAKNANRIHEAGKHLLELINEVLDISRIEAGRMSLSPEGVDVRQLIAEVIGLVEPMAREREITVSWEGSSDAGMRATADRQRLRQVLLNLASNAIKYNRAEGSVTFAIRAAAPGRVRVEVRDTGPGIPPEKLARLFTPFDRLDAERTHTEIEGTGLGLSLSRKLVEVMGGEITVSSTPGEGSTFTVELKAASDTLHLHRDQFAATPSDETVSAPTDENHSLLVLYIEDNPDNLTLVEQVIEQCPGAKLVSATNGIDGITLARDRRPHLIFLDFHLPDLNGDEVLQRLKNDERTRDIPVYMLSADAMSDQIERLKKLGATDYLTKPLDIERFLATLDAAIANSKRTG